MERGAAAGSDTAATQGGGVPVFNHVYSYEAQYISAAWRITGCACFSV